MGFQSPLRGRAMRRLASLQENNKSGLSREKNFNLAVAALYAVASRELISISSQANGVESPCVPTSSASMTTSMFLGLRIDLRTNLSGVLEFLHRSSTKLPVSTSRAVLREKNRRRSQWHTNSPHDSPTPSIRTNLSPSKMCSHHTFSLSFRPWIPLTLLWLDVSLELGSLSSKSCLADEP